MSRKKIPWIIFYSTSLFFGLFLFFLEGTLPDGKLHASFLNIGQGDSILITTPKGKHILIDGGPYDNILQVLPQKLSYFDHTIDLIVLSHPHSDHLSGLLSVLQRYNVRFVLLSGVKTRSEEYNAFLQLIDDKNIIHVSPQHDISIEEGISLNILSPSDVSREKYIPEDQLNDNSVVFVLRYGETSFLFTGDISQQQENNILLSGVNIDSHIIKVAHHGSKYSSSSVFLHAVSPRFAIISVGKSNRFKHPHYQTISTIHQENIQLYRTDEQGTIDLACGTQNDCRVETEKYPHEFENSRNVSVN